MFECISGLWTTGRHWNDFSGNCTLIKSVYDSLTSLVKPITCEIQDWYFFTSIFLVCSSNYVI